MAPMDREAFLSICKKIDGNTYIFKFEGILGIFRPDGKFISNEDAWRLIKETKDLAANLPTSIPCKIAGNYIFVFPRSLFKTTAELTTDFNNGEEKIEWKRDGNIRSGTETSEKNPQLKRKIQYKANRNGFPLSNLVYQYVRHAEELDETEDHFDVDAIIEAMKNFDKNPKTDDKLKKKRSSTVKTRSQTAASEAQEEEDTVRKLRSRSIKTRSQSVALASEDQEEGKKERRRGGSVAVKTPRGRASTVAHREDHQKPRTRSCTVGARGGPPAMNLRPRTRQTSLAPVQKAKKEKKQKPDSPVAPLVRPMAPAVVKKRSKTVGSLSERQPQAALAPPVVAQRINIHRPSAPGVRQIKLEAPEDKKPDSPLVRPVTPAVVQRRRASSCKRQPQAALVPPVALPVRQYKLEVPQDHKPVVAQNVKEPTPVIQKQAVKREREEEPEERADPAPKKMKLTESEGQLQQKRDENQEQLENELPQREFDQERLQRAFYDFSDNAITVKKRFFHFDPSASLMHPSDSSNFVNKCKKIDDQYFSFSIDNLKGLYLPNSELIDCDKAVDLLKQSSNILNEMPKSLPSETPGSYVFVVSQKVFEGNKRRNQVLVDFMSPWDSYENGKLNVKQWNRFYKDDGTVVKIAISRHKLYTNIRRQVVFLSDTTGEPISPVFYQYALENEKENLSKPTRNKTNGKKQPKTKEINGSKSTSLRKQMEHELKNTKKSKEKLLQMHWNLPKEQKRKLLEMKQLSGDSSRTLSNLILFFDFL